MLTDLINKFKTMIIRSKISSDQEDGNYVYNATVSAFDQSTVSEIVYPYGYAASAPSGALAITFMISNQPENKTSIAYDPATRFTGLNAGEAIMGNQIEQTFIKFNQDGTINIKTKSLVIIDGDVTIKGNLIVEGTINATGNISSSNEIVDGAGTTVSDIKAAFNPHTHSDPQGGNTGTPSTSI